MNYQIEIFFGEVHEVKKDLNKWLLQVDAESIEKIEFQECGEHQMFNQPGIASKSRLITAFVTYKV